MRKVILTKEEMFDLVKKDMTLETLTEMLDYCLYNDHTKDSIAEKFSVSTKLIGKLGLRSWKTHIQNLMVVEPYERGLSTKAIAEETGLTVFKVESAITVLGLRKKADKVQKETILKTKSTEWRKVFFPGCNDYFIVGNKDGEIINTNKNILLTGSVNAQDGYKYINLTRIKPHKFSSGKVSHSKNVAIHRVVAMAFSPYNGTEASPTKEFFNYITSQELTVNHDDGDKYNNDASNLEWMTNSDNVKHSHRTGLTKQHGEDNHAARFTAKQVEAVCKLVLKGKTTGEIVKLVKGVDRYLVSSVRNKTKWQTVSDKYFKEPIPSPNITESLTEDKIREVSQLLSTNEYEQKVISKMTGVSLTTIGHILHKRKHTEISDEYFVLED